MMRGNFAAYFSHRALSRRADRIPAVPIGNMYVCAGGFGKHEIALHIDSSASGLIPFSPIMLNSTFIHDPLPAARSLFSQ